MSDPLDDLMAQHGIKVDPLDALMAQHGVTAPAVQQQTQSDWQSQVKPVTTFNGKPSVQRPDGGVWYGPDQGNAGKPGWFDAVGRRMGLTNGQDTAPPSTSVGGLAGAGVRGLAPVTAGAALGAAVGAPFAGVGAIPGAAAGAAAVGGAQLVGDPLVSGINRMFGTKYQMPTEAVQHLLTSLGVPEPKTTAERMVQAGVSTMAGAGGQIGLGRSLAGQGFSPAAQTVGKALSSQPAVQLAGAAGGGVASQGAAEAGGGPLAQMGAGLAGSVIAGAPFAARIPKISSSPIGASPMEPTAAEHPTAPVTAPVSAEISPTDLGTLIQKASSGSGSAATAAKQQIADMASYNPKAAASATRLGIELPQDVFADNPQIRAAAGLTRSAAGSAAEAGWRNTVSNAEDQADQVTKDALGATYEGGTVSPGVVSQKVRDRLVSTRQTLANEASNLYQTVDESVPWTSPAVTDNLSALLQKNLNEVGPNGLTTQERRLMGMVNDPDGATYGRIIREKSLIGKAIAGKDSTYGNMDAGTLKQLYGALAEDQLATVSNVGSPELEQQLRSANLLTAKHKALGDLIVSNFGDNVNGDIAGKMRAAISGSSKGGSADFSNLMEIVPDDLKKEVVSTALAAATRSMRGAERGGFGFSEFAKTYQGLKANTPVYQQITDAIGPESSQIMDDLYEVSKRLTDARANVLTTGKANQGIINSINAEGLVSKVLQSTATKGVATGVSALGGGPVAAGVTGSLMSAISGGKKNAVAAAGEMFNSPEFQSLLIESATKPAVSIPTSNALIKSQAFQDFAKTVGLPTGKVDQFNWVMNALRSKNNAQEPK